VKPLVKTVAVLAHKRVDVRNRIVFAVEPALRVQVLERGVSVVGGAHCDWVRELVLSCLDEKVA